MPDQPGADLLDVGPRAEDISCAMMAMRSCVGVGVRSLWWWVGIGVGSGGKKCDTKAIAMSAGWADRPTGVWMGGIRFWVCPLCQRIASYKLVRVASLRYL